MAFEKWMYIIRLRLRSLFQRSQVETELSEELQDHLERKTRELVAAGLTPTEARRKATREFGGVERSAAGGDIAFGTDVRYTNALDATVDYQLMQKAGMNFRQILEALNTTPAKWLHIRGVTGRLVSGENADVVVLPGDPRIDVASLASIRATVRQGKVVFGELVPQTPNLISSRAR